MKPKIPALNLRHSLLARRMARQFPFMVKNIQHLLAFAISRGLGP